MVMSGNGVKSLLERASEAAEKIRESIKRGDHIRIESHLDADGLAAAGIMGAALHRQGASFHIRIERWFDENVAEEILSGKPDLLILTDIGSGYLDIIGEKLSEMNIIILDHHQPIGEPLKNLIHVNPHLFNIDGSRDLSGSGTAYLVVKELSKENIDLSYLAVVGALGDIQDKYEERSLGGVNEIIVEDAVKSGYLKTETDLLLFGRETRPIHKALAYTTTPFIPGISGEEDQSLALLATAGIKPKEGDRWRALRDLSMEEKRRLFSALTDYLASRGVKSDLTMSLIGTVYTLVREEPWTPLRDAREFAMLLNATGRMDRAGLGVSICMGDRGRCLQEANEVLEEYRAAIVKYLNWLSENPDRIEELSHIYVVHGDNFIDERMISTISTILLTNIPNPEKPIIAYSTLPEEKVIKVSARTIDALTERGIDLGEILRIAAEECLGKGGGHDVAAGAQVPYTEKDSFIKRVNYLVGMRLKEG